MVVVHRDVNAILALIVLNPRKAVIVSRVGLVDREGEGLLCILLVKRQALQLLHGHGDIRSRGGVLELLSELAIRTGAREREAEVTGSHGTIDHRLGHGDAARAVGAVVHARLVDVRELGVVGHIGVLVVAVAHGGQQLAMVVRVIAVVAIRNRHGHGADVRVERHTVDVGGLGALLVSDLVHLEGVRADLGEGHLSECEVHRVLVGDRHRLGGGEDRLGVVVDRAQLEVEGLAFLHLATLEGLGAVNDVVARQRGRRRLVLVGERELLRSLVRRGLDVNMAFASLGIGHLGDLDLNLVRSLVVGHAVLAALDLGDLVDVGVAHIVAIEGDGRHVELVAHVADGGHVALGVLRRLGGVIGGHGQVVTGAAVGHIAAQRLHRELELVGGDGVVVGGVGVGLPTIDVDGALVGQVVVGEGRSRALNGDRRILLGTRVVLEHLQLRRLDLQLTVACVHDLHGQTVRGI